jgi:prepilin-type N-terminal cleavage/methylation domain-containing protein
MCPCTGPRRGAFTLVELLVVIGIIAALVAMLLPALTRAQRAVRDVKCQSNLRQIALAAFMYAHDWDGVLPRADKEFDPHPSNASPHPVIEDWLKTVESYLRPPNAGYTYKTEPLYICPSWQAPNTGANSTNYGMNWLIDLQAFTGVPTPTNYKLSQMHRTSQVYMFGDKASQPLSFSPIIAQNAGIVKLPELRHGTGSNTGQATGLACIVFLDGHTDTINKTDRGKLKNYDFKQR